MFDRASAPGASADSALTPRAFETALLALPVGVAMYDAEHRLVLTNPQFRTLYGLGETHLRPGLPSQVVLQAIGAPQSHVLGKTIGEQHFAPRSLTSVRGDRVGVTIQSLADGGWLEMHVIESETGQIKKAPKATTDLDATQDFMPKAQFAASVDAHIRGTLLGSLVAVHSHKVDGLEAVRVEHGVTTSDMIVRLMAKRLKRAVREGDLITQLSDERFVVLQTGLETAGAGRGIRRAPYQDPWRALSGCSVTDQRFPCATASPLHLPMQKMPKA